MSYRNDLSRQKEMHISLPSVEGYFGRNTERETENKLDLPISNTMFGNQGFTVKNQKLGINKRNILNSKTPNLMHDIGKEDFKGHQMDRQYSKSTLTLKMPSKKFKKIKVYEPNKFTKKTSGGRSYSNLRMDQTNSKRSKLSHNQSEDAQQFSRFSKQKNKYNEMSIPEAVSRVYLINVEAAQNQVNLESQIRTSSSLNRNFTKKFKQRSNVPSGRSIDKFNPVLSYQNKSYQLKRKVYESPYQKQQKIIGRYVLKKQFSQNLQESQLANSGVTQNFQDNARIPNGRNSKINQKAIKNKKKIIFKNRDGEKGDPRVRSEGRNVSRINRPKTTQEAEKSHNLKLNGQAIDPLNNPNATKNSNPKSTPKSRTNQTSQISKSFPHPTTTTNHLLSKLQILKQKVLPHRHPQPPTAPNPPSSTPPPPTWPLTAATLLQQQQKLLEEVRQECVQRKVVKKKLVKELEDEKVRITLLEVRKDEREKRIKQRIISRKGNSQESRNSSYEPTLQDREDIKELKKEKEDLVRSKANYIALQKELGKLVASNAMDPRESKAVGNQSSSMVQPKGEHEFDVEWLNDHFTIVNKEVIDPESYDVNSAELPSIQYYPGTNWKWNQFNMKRLMMSDVKDHVEKMAQEVTTTHSKEQKKRQEKLVAKLFKKRIVQFDILPNMSDKKKKLTRIANAIIVAARKMKEHNITLEELMSGEKTL
ncbi:unnamed protein product [Moneuplotes crassus]|uniref:Uncharacterized protein n=1 Tax=Euplotes crassus TaxID=5936 RepID=A0AAD1Y9H4_EUPCR|nr:unnamed protein product [Moneuplotes crassus]